MNKSLSAMPRNRSQNRLGRAAAFEGQEGIARLLRRLQSAIVRRDAPLGQGISWPGGTLGGRESALKSRANGEFRF